MVLRIVLLFSSIFIRYEITATFPSGCTKALFFARSSPPTISCRIYHLFPILSNVGREFLVALNASIGAGGGTPGIIESLQEMITNAAVAGAPLHVLHINSQALKKTPEALRMTDGARARGL
jgi:hypothetical protein